jgi:hypothetical protein
LNTETTPFAAVFSRFGLSRRLAMAALDSFFYYTLKDAFLYLHFIIDAKFTRPERLPVRARY